MNYRYHRGMSTEINNSSFANLRDSEKLSPTVKLFNHSLNGSIQDEQTWTARERTEADNLSRMIGQKSEPIHHSLAERNTSLHEKKSSS
jgi:hypothetical protein